MGEAIIQVSDLTFTYPDNERPALADINMSVQAGEWIALIGPNGSGKSTLAKTLNGLLVPDQGDIYVKGLPLNEETVWQIRQSIGMVFQNPDNQFVGATVEDDVAFGMENAGISREEMAQRLDDALEQVHMLKYKKHEPARLSGGQKQRVALASIIALRPDVIIMDEATSMLDPVGRESVIEAIDRLKETYELTVISITHDLEEAARADRIFVMNEGHLIRTAPPAEIFTLGEGLIDIGLDVPFAQKLQKELSERGVNVPTDYMDEEALVEWLTEYYLKM